MIFITNQNKENKFELLDFLLAFLSSDKEPNYLYIENEEFIYNNLL